jgi:hypothetical protein
MLCRRRDDTDIFRSCRHSEQQVLQVIGVLVLVYVHIF